ncbi:hypothetical protein B0181_00845 [Moraxella caviae]|uniref:Uncharacterized protein n=1 Tax=Moraxella caviae TaxID=34060 RepID=A0A1T0ACL7_9GAMM|nr:hypothetical protein [Moraxella caviae]OOR93061.1 hypothetical protein B0181_00845 [Moraxella caviae]STZ10035.1 Uncharacterised protein [Moraxella caviae]VEW12774.1 Uncharacterised protein [Moraxella caviae]VEW13226.1 Uncharacterised protein [Moraxella caviae]
MIAHTKAGKSLPSDNAKFRHQYTQLNNAIEGIILTSADKQLMDNTLHLSKADFVQAVKKHLNA